MGLAINIGALAESDEEDADWLREQLARANELLEAAGLPAHEEPEELPLAGNRATCDSFPYSFLHHLRRAAAHRRHDPKWVATPVRDAEDPANDSLVRAATYDFHLLIHSDAEGFYVPVDFDEVLFDEEQRLAGGMLGSSQRLRAELVEVAPALGIKLDGRGELADEEASRISEIAEAQQTPLFRELLSWMALYEAARLSIQLRTAIVFQ